MSETQADVYKQPLKSLADTSKFSLADVSDKPLVSVIFQPDCSWCDKQIKQLISYQNACEGTFDTVLVGALGKRQQLKRELNRYSVDLPALQSNAKFLRKVGKIKATPVVLFYDEKGELLGRNRGYLESVRMQKALEILTNGQCAPIGDE